MTEWLHFHFQFSSFQLLSHVQLFATPWIAARQASLSITNSRSSPKLMSIESVMQSSHNPVIPFFSCPQSLPASGSFPMSQLFAWGGQSPTVGRVTNIYLVPTVCQALFQVLRIPQKSTQIKCLPFWGRKESRTPETQNLLEEGIWDLCLMLCWRYDR